MKRRSLMHYGTYLGAIVVLIFPLSWLSMPDTVAVDGQGGGSPGKLAQLRDSYQLGQANLGEIDPTSETIKLATLGMRGIAANLLWEKANDAKLKEDWTGLAAVLEQIAHLQPNYVGVWMFQGWNVAYNVSAEWDDYRDRYYWVIQGVDFLQEGTRYNQNEPKLTAEVGRVVSHKIGRADERVQFRRLFRDDDDFHARQFVHQRDNWLFGKEYFRAAERLIDDEGVTLGTMSPLIFHSQGPMCQINYAVNVEEDGNFGTQARSAWDEALAEWQAFGRRELPSFPREAVHHLSDFDPLTEELVTKRERFAQLTPGLAEQIREEKMATLTEEQRQALRIELNRRSPDDMRLAAEAEMVLQVSELEMADRLPPEQQEEAQQLAEDLVRLNQTLGAIRSDRDVVNFEYWESRCRSEAREDAIDTHEALFLADAAVQRADLLTARELYEQAFTLWRNVVDDNPLLEDDQTASDMGGAIARYFEILRQLDEDLPGDEFPLQQILEKQRETGLIPGLDPVM